MRKNELFFNIDFTFSGITRTRLPESDPLATYHFTRDHDYHVGGVLDIRYKNEPLIINTTGSPGVSDYFWAPFIQILEEGIPAIIDGATIQINLYDNPHHLTFVPTYGDDLFIYFISAVSGIEPSRSVHVRKDEFFSAVFQCAERTLVSIRDFNPEMESSELMHDLKFAISRARFNVMNSRYNESAYPLITDARIKGKLISQASAPQNNCNKNTRDCRCNLQISDMSSITATMERYSNNRKLEKGKQFFFELCAAVTTVTKSEKQDYAIELIQISKEHGSLSAYWYTGSIIQINPEKNSLLLNIGYGSLEIFLPENYRASDYKIGFFICAEAPITIVLRVHPVSE